MTKHRRISPMGREISVQKAMACLPDDVIVQILSRVPAKSVARFRCVSKHWLSLTTDSTFIKLHLQQSVENNDLNFIIFGCLVALQYKFSCVTCASWIYCLPNNSLDDQHDLQVETLPLDCFKYSSIAGSCNGLVCLFEENRGMVFNPTTTQFHSFQFDNQKKGCGAYGLGYDYLMDDYKLVQFIRGSTPVFSNVRANSEIVVHSLNDSSSVKISDVPYYAEYTHDCGVYLDGALHWVGSQTKPLAPPQHGKLIVSFDVAHKVVREFPVPDSVDTYSQIKLGLLHGQLSSFISLSSSLEIWIMKTYGAGDSWYKLGSIDKTVYGGTLQYAGLLCFSKSGGVLLSYGEDLFLYDPEQKTCKKIQIQGIKRGGFVISGIENTLVSCVASCVWLQSGNSARLSPKNPQEIW